MTFLKTIFILLLSVLTLGISAQHEPQKYYPLEDQMVQEKLDAWQDLKFGMLMHWGPYSQWGIVESWSICPEDYGWCQRKKPGTPDTYYEYVKAYENLQTTFNPVEFDPDKWASAARDAGMRYLVFTTKHHDGFSMFDTNIPITRSLHQTPRFIPILKRTLSKRYLMLSAVKDYGPVPIFQNRIGTTTTIGGLIFHRRIAMSTMIRKLILIDGTIM